MKSLTQRIIQLRNPHFQFDPNLNTAALVQFIWQQIWSLIRGGKWLLQFKNPKMALLGRRVHFFNASKISFGQFLKLGDSVYLSALGTEGIQLGDNVSIGAYSRVICSTSLNEIGKYIRIGNNVGIGEYAYLGGAGGLEIGNDCIVGQYFSCHPENHNYANSKLPIRQQGVVRKGIKIEENCWIGSKVTILDGVKIGSGCVIAAGAVVTHSFPPNSIIVGVPARKVKERILGSVSHDLSQLQVLKSNYLDNLEARESKSKI